MTNFDQALETFVSGADKILNDHMKANFPGLLESTDYVIRTDGGRKFVKVIREETNKKSGTVGHCSVHCFIAKEDGETKALGKFKAGDVLKAATWKSPAKGARGNIFDENSGLGRMTPYGTQYN